MKLSIIVVSYNTKELTINCINSVIEQTAIADYEILLIDNNSTDGSFEALEDKFSNKSNIMLIKSETNLGFAQANNVASKTAVGEYLLLLNPDTLVLDGAIDKLLVFAEGQTYEGIFGGRTYTGDGELDPTSCWKKPTLWSVLCFALGLTAILKRNYLFDPESYGSWKRDSIRKVDIVTGCFLLIKKSSWEKLDGFSPEFFMYAEEADLCLRAIKKNIQPVLFPDAKIIHFGGASEKIIEDKMVRLLKAKILLINRHWSSKFSYWLGKNFYLFGAALRAWNPIGYFVSYESTMEWRRILCRYKEWV